ncbi:MAG: hypothetical protein K6E22_09090 [Treponema sp.]|nr:hypothetical protein [Treponema sp.]
MPTNKKPWMATQQHAELLRNSAILGKSKDGFSKATYAAMEGRDSVAEQWRRKPEPRNGGDAKACPVELAKVQNGRAGKSIVQKNTRKKAKVRLL